MKHYTTKNKSRRRAVSRNLTEAPITYRPYASRGTFRESDGVMRNFSSEGSYIETTNKYNSGTILIIRTVSYPELSEFMTWEERPRSICLAEVKWWRELSDIGINRYGIGLKYLN